MWQCPLSFEMCECCMWFEENVRSASESAVGIRRRVEYRVVFFFIIERSETVDDVRPTLVGGEEETSFYDC